MSEPRHGVVRSIFVRHKGVDEKESFDANDIQSVGISNALFGTYVESSFKLDEGLTRPGRNDSNIC